MSDPKAYLESHILSTPHTAVIVGGCSGIGAAVARRLAQTGCSRIVVMGRRDGGDFAASLKDLAPEGVDVKGEFVSGDVGTIKGMVAAAEALQKVGGIDYLFLCQGGFIDGVLRVNDDGDCAEFAVQALSRFVIAYKLSDSGALNDGASVVTICNPGNSYDLDLDDLSLKKPAETRSKLMFLLDQSFRDSTVLDSVYTEMNERYPKYRYFHIYPGLIKTENMNPWQMPFPVNYVWAAMLPTISPTPDQFAVKPVWIALDPDEADKRSPSRLFGDKLQPYKLGKWASDSENRIKLWNMLVKRVEEVA